MVDNNKVADEEEKNNDRGILNANMRIKVNYIYKQTYQIYINLSI